MVTAEELGGGEVHTRLSGVADHLAENDEHALAIMRDIVATLPEPSEAIHGRQTISITHRNASRDTAKPIVEPPSAGSLLDIVPLALSEAYDAREIITRIVDGGKFHEFKRDYGTTLVTAFAHIYGHRVGIIANNGVLFAESALKGAHFIQLCQQRDAPIIFLQNITGFMVGREYETGGIAKHGAKMVNTVATTSVPKLTVVVGGSFGAGNYSMCGRAYSPRFLWLWPGARVSSWAAPKQQQCSLPYAENKSSRLAASGVQSHKANSKPRSANNTKPKVAPTIPPRASGMTALSNQTKPEMCSGLPLM